MSSETRRYSRQELFYGIQKSGQEKIAASHVLIIGLGALGSSSAENLARSGVGQLTLVDRDYVEMSNLQRQTLFTEADAENKLPKVIAGRNRLHEIRSDLKIHVSVTDVTYEEIGELLEGVDLVLDATDNFETRMLINDACFEKGLPWIYGACVGSYGMSYTVLPSDASRPCFHCLIDDFEELSSGTNGTCDTIGIIGPAVQMVVAHQVTEALKILTGNQDKLRGSLAYFDLWSNESGSIEVDSLKKKSCPTCGEARDYAFLSASKHTKSTVLCGRNTVQIRPSWSSTQERELSELADVFAGRGLKTSLNPYLLMCETEDFRLVFFKDGRVLVHGTSDESRAKSIYHQLVG